MIKCFSRKIIFGVKTINSNQIYSNIRLFSNFSSTSSRDEKFWQEYSKPRRKGEKTPSIGTQDIKIYQTDKQWIYAERFSLKNTEFLGIIKEIEKDKQPPFLIIDVREESEFLIFKFPEKNPKGAIIPIRYRNSKEILTDYYDDFPVDKYLLIIDSIGLRSRGVASFLIKEGYKALYVEGGIDMFKPIAKDVLDLD